MKAAQAPTEHPGLEWREEETGRSCRACYGWEEKAEPGASIYEGCGGEPSPAWSHAGPGAAVRHRPLVAAAAAAQ